MHIDPVSHISLLHLHPDMGFFFPEPDQAIILYGPMRFCGSTYIGGFQDICLTLGVIPIKDIRPVGKCDLSRFVISEIFQCDGFNVRG